MLGAGVLLAGLSYGGFRVHAAGQAASGGLYTAAQAKRGAEVYQSQQCAMCHGPNLEGTGGAPPLSGNMFSSMYSGQSIAALYDQTKLMPQTNPGSLTPQQMADVMAYMLSVNKYPAGDTELPTDRDKLKAIQLPKLGD